MFHASYISYDIGFERKRMTPNFVSKPRNLVIITLLFYLLLFAIARVCCYFVILRQNYFLIPGGYKSFSV